MVFVVGGLVLGLDGELGLEDRVFSYVKYFFWFRFWLKNIRVLENI